MNCIRQFIFSFSYWKRLSIMITNWRLHKSPTTSILYGVSVYENMRIIIWIFGFLSNTGVECAALSNFIFIYLLGNFIVYYVLVKKCLVCVSIAHSRKSNRTIWFIQPFDSIKLWLWHSLGAQCHCRIFYGSLPFFSANVQRMPVSTSVKIT